MVWLRLGGSGTDAAGLAIVWSVAQGARGTRWRETGSQDDHLLRTVLIELTPAGAPARLELSTGAGLLTLHPGSDGSTLHGNVVTPGGIRHVALPWGPAHQLLVVPSAIGAAVLVRTLDGALLVGEEVRLDVVRVDDDLVPVADAWTVTYVDLGTWWLRSTTTDLRLAVALDPVGLPLLADADIWPLET